jgi:hypothetical protein
MRSRTVTDSRSCFTIAAAVSKGWQCLGYKVEMLPASTVATWGQEHSCAVCLQALDVSIMLPRCQMKPLSAGRAHSALESKLLASRCKAVSER